MTKLMIAVTLLALVGCAETPTPKPTVEYVAPSTQMAICYDSALGKSYEEFIPFADKFVAIYGENTQLLRKGKRTRTKYMRKFFVDKATARAELWNIFQCNKY